MPERTAEAERVAIVKWMRAEAKKLENDADSLLKQGFTEESGKVSRAWLKLYNASVAIESGVHDRADPDA